MKIHMPMTKKLKILLSWFSLICKGVWLSFVFESTWAILPISVFIPVAVTTTLPRP